MADSDREAEDWRDVSIGMEKEKVERLMSPSQWNTRMDPDDVVEKHVEVLVRDTNTAKNTVDCQMGLVYGNGEKQMLDIYGARDAAPDAPIFVYFHGGYWQFPQLGVFSSGFMAPALLARGGIVVVPGYDLAPSVSMPELVLQCVHAVKYCLDFARQRGSRGVYVGGHSAGGHLTAMMLHEDFGENAHLFKGAFPISGVFDLRPLVDTYVNGPLHMDKSKAWNMSPAKHIAHIKLPETFKVIVAVGGGESPEFIRQSEVYDKCLREVVLKSKLIIVPERDHFNVLEEMADKEYILIKELLGLMDLS